MLGEGAAPPRGCGVAIVNDTTTLYLGLAGVLDAAKELDKLAKKRADVEGRLAALRRRMELESYAKTPEDVKQTDLERTVKLEAELEAVAQAAADMQQLLDDAGA